MSLRTALVATANLFRGLSTAAHLRSLKTTISNDLYRAYDKAEATYEKDAALIERAVLREFEAARAALTHAAGRAGALAEAGLLTVEHSEIAKDIEAARKKVFGEL